MSAARRGRPRRPSASGSSRRTLRPRGAEPRRMTHESVGASAFLLSPPPIARSRWRPNANLAAGGASRGGVGLLTPALLLRPEGGHQARGNRGFRNGRAPTARRSRERAQPLSQAKGEPPGSRARPSSAWSCICILTSAVARRTRRANSGSSAPPATRTRHPVGAGLVEWTTRSSQGTARPGPDRAPTGPGWRRQSSRPDCADYLLPSGTPGATPTRTATAARPPRRCSTPAAPT